MAVTSDILRSYRAPRAVMRDLLRQGPREDRALVYLMLGCLLVFIGQWPRLARESHLTPELTLDLLITSALLGWLFLAPLVFYGLAALSHAVARVFGGRGNWFSARLAMFWALLAASPFWLLNGLVAGFVGPGSALTATGAVTGIAFLYIWIGGLLEAEFPSGPSADPASI
jgi:hypothetical protein